MLLFQNCNHKIHILTYFNFTSNQNTDQLTFKFCKKQKKYGLENTITNEFKF